MNLVHGGTSKCLQLSLQSKCQSQYVCMNSLHCLNSEAKTGNKLASHLSVLAFLTDQIITHLQHNKSFSKFILEIFKLHLT